MNFSDAGKLGAAISSKNIRQSAIDKYYADPSICQNCSRVIQVRDHERPSVTKKKKFCDHSCAAQKNNLGKTKNPKKIRFCKGCGNEIDKKGCSYCSACSLIGKNIHRKPFEDITYSRSLKNRLIIERGPICERCGTTEWMGEKVPLVLDHIDGNSDNNSRENLRLVCGNCDMQLPTYKGRNIGRGRVWRRKRYQEGKSY